MAWNAIKLAGSEEGRAWVCFEMPIRQVGKLARAQLAPASGLPTASGLIGIS
jgi:hypothetical protein